MSDHDQEPDQITLDIEPVVLEKAYNADEIVLHAAPMGESKQKDEQTWAPEGTIEPPVPGEQLQRLTDFSDVRAACIEAVARNTVGLGYTMEVQEDHEAEVSGDELVRAQNTLEALASRDMRLDCPSFTELMYAVKWDEEEVGLGAIEVSRNRETGQIDGLFHAPGQHIRRLTDRTGWVVGIPNDALLDKPDERRYYNFGEKVEYDDSGRPQPRVQRGKRWKKNELLVFRLYTSKSRDYGLPRDIQLAVGYAAARLANEWNVGFFDSSGTPPTLLFVQGVETREGNRVTYKVNDGLTERIAQTMKADGSRGARVAVIPVPPGTQTQEHQLGKLSERDMGFQKFQESHARRVIARFRLQPIFVPFLEDGGRYDAEVQRAITLEQVFDPEQTRYEEALNPLLRELGLDALRLRFRRLAIEGDAVKRTSADKMVEAGNITRGEYRAAHGLPPFPEGGDSPFPEGFNDELLGTGQPDGAENRVIEGDSQKGLRPGLAGRQRRQPVRYGDGNGSDPVEKP